jgi:3-dehydrosphinganine reductase
VLETDQKKNINQPSPHPHTGRFLEQDIAVHTRTMDLNYFGALRCARAALPGMVRRRSGSIVFVSSAAGVCGFAGFASYSPSKWALRGLADCLRNELLGLGVSVHVAYPPDTDTPGYARESTTKPPECHAASRAAGDTLYSADAVAARMLRGLERGHYHLGSPDLGQNLLVAAMAGLSPHPLPAILEFLIAPIIAIALRVFGGVIDRATRRANEERRRNGD